MIITKPARRILRLDRNKYRVIRIAAQGPTGPTGPQPDLSDATPQPLGTAAPGASGAASRDDHIHPMPGAADVGADPAGTATATVGVHETTYDHPALAAHIAATGNPHGTTGSDINIGYPAPTNYTPLDDSAIAHCQAIDAALASGGVWSRDASGYVTPATTTDDLVMGDAATVYARYIGTPLQYLDIDAPNEVRINTYFRATGNSYFLPATFGTLAITASGSRVLATASNSNGLTISGGEKGSDTEPQTVRIESASARPSAAIYQNGAALELAGGNPATGGGQGGAVLLQILDAEPRTAEMGLNTIAIWRDTSAGALKAKHMDDLGVVTTTTLGTLA